MLDSGNIFSQNIEVTLVTILAIGYVSIIYILIGLFVTYQLDNFLFVRKRKEFNEEKVNEISFIYLVMETIITFVVISIIAYLIRNIVRIIPFPFNFDNVIDYHNIREVYTGAVLIIILITFSQTLNTQYKEIKYKLSGKIY